jgi:hypothetical protein
MLRLQLDDSSPQPGFGQKVSDDECGFLLLGHLAALRVLEASSSASLCAFTECS